jgi:hypothetical protein
MQSNSKSKHFTDSISVNISTNKMMTRVTFTKKNINILKNIHLYFKRK